MSVHAFTRRRSADILNVRGQRVPEPADDLGGWDVSVSHGVAERDAGSGDRATGLCAAKLEAARGGRLVGRAAVAAVEAVVGELDEHLHVCVGRAAKAFNETLAVALVCLHAQIVCAKLCGEVLLGLV